jgi:2-keto-3-deoxy-6-phosphogluconate aldolase
MSQSPLTPSFPQPAPVIAVRVAPAALQEHALNVFGRSPVIPIISIDKFHRFEQLAEATKYAYWNTGHQPTIEIVMRDPASMKSGLAEIQRLKGIFGSDINILAGSAVSPEDVTAAANAGVDGLVSGGYSQAVAHACEENNVPYLPGFMTLQEITSAIDAGYKILKFFPSLMPTKFDAIAAPLSRLQGVDISRSGEKAVTISARTASEIFAASTAGHSAIALDPANTKDEIEAIHAFLAANNVRACCTGGIRVHNIADYARRPSVAGIGMMYLVEEAEQSAEQGADFTSALTQAIHRDLETFMTQRQSALDHDALRKER